MSWCKLAHTVCVILHTAKRILELLGIQMIIVCQKKFPKFDTKIYAVSYYMGKVNITQNTQYPLCKICIRPYSRLKDNSI